LRKDLQKLVEVPASSHFSLLVLLALVKQTKILPTSFTDGMDTNERFLTGIADGQW
jgi:hypothetical protein